MSELTQQLLQKLPPYFLLEPRYALSLDDENDTLPRSTKSLDDATIFGFRFAYMGNLPTEANFRKFLGIQRAAKLIARWPSLFIIKTKGFHQEGPLSELLANTYFWDFIIPQDSHIFCLKNCNPRGINFSPVQPRLEERFLAGVEA